MIIQGQKVNLRKNRITDAKRYLTWLKDPEINQFLAKDFKGLTLEKEIEHLQKAKKDKSKVRFAICNDKGKHIGEIVLRGLDSKDKQGDIGIVIGDKNAQNKGFGTEAIKLIIDHGFNTLGLHRIELTVHNDNKRAIEVYQKIGFKIEGLKRENVLKNGEFKDSYMMGILKREFKNER